MSSSTTPQHASLLDSGKWDLLHQEGAILLEQANRKIDPQATLMLIGTQSIEPLINQLQSQQQQHSTTLPTSQPLTPSNQSSRLNIDLPYLERTIQRLSQIQVEYLDMYESLTDQLRRFKKLLLTKTTLASSPSTQHNALSSRGPLNLAYSPVDITIALDNVLSIYNQELNHKLEIIAIFRTLYDFILEHLLIQSSFSVSSLFDDDLQSSHQSQMNSDNSIIERWPWLAELTTTTINTSDNTTSSSQQLQSNSITAHDNKIIYTSQRTDLNGLIALFYQRPGFDLPQYNRNISIIKSASGEVKTVLELVAPSSVGGVTQQR